MFFLPLETTEGELGGKQVGGKHFTTFLINKQPKLPSHLTFQVSMLRFDHLCYGQWHSMINLSPRLPIKHPTLDVIETTQSLRDKLNHIKTSDNRLVTEKPDFEIIDEDYLL